MQSFAFVLELPDNLAKNAQELGLLDAKQIIALLEKELERRYRVNRLIETAEALQKLEGRISADEISEEIASYRREKRMKSAAFS